mgnify:FL=1
MRKLSGSHPLVKATWLQLCMLAMLAGILKILHFGFSVENSWGSFLIALGIIWLIGYEVSQVILLAIACYSDKLDNKFGYFKKAIVIRLLMLAIIALVLFLVHSCLNPIEPIGFALSIALTIEYAIVKLWMISKIFTAKAD